MKLPSCEFKARFPCIVRAFKRINGKSCSVVRVVFFAEHAENFAQSVYGTSGLQIIYLDETGAVQKDILYIDKSQPEKPVEEYFRSIEIKT